MLPRLQCAVVLTDRSKTVKAACGIKVMWVSVQARRKGIATQLLDTARFATDVNFKPLLSQNCTDVCFHASASIAFLVLAEQMKQHHG